MDHKKIFNDVEIKYKLKPLSIEENHADEVYARVSADQFKPMCLALHGYLRSPVMSFFALDRIKEKGIFELLCAFQSLGFAKWIFVSAEVSGEKPEFDSLSKDIYSAALFEREILEMFGIRPSNLCCQ